VSALSGLGWLQFERLCDELLRLEAGIPASAWEGDADRHRGFVHDEPITLRGHLLTAPVIVRCLWLPPGPHARERRLHAAAQGLETRILAAGEAKPSLLTFVNLTPEELGNDEVEFEVNGRHRGISRVVYGEAELLEAIAAHPQLRLDLPSLLSVGDTRARLDADALERSTLDLDAALELAPVFVPTTAYARTLATLRKHAFGVVTGPPEMGKTAIARMLGLALLSDGWEVHECTRPEQVWERLDPRRPQLFIADDAFGSTEYRPDAADRWAQDLDRALRATDATHWLVWTSRPAPLHAGLRRIHRERGGERFPQPAAVQVDAADLSPPEKTLILYRHARAAELTAGQRRLVYENGAAIVAHPHFTPERIRRFVAGRLRELRGSGEVPGVVDAELSEPTQAMARSYAALAEEHRELLLAMLDAPPGPVAERDLAAALRRHATNGLSHAPVDLVDRLTDHFVRVLR
jgi:conflict system STAND superfamily ATPase